MKRWFGMTCTLLAGLALIVGTGCGGSTEQKQPAKPLDSRQFMPPTLDLVTTMDWANSIRMLKTNDKVRPRFEQGFRDGLRKQDPAMSDALESLQFDLFDDIDSLTVGGVIDPTKPGEGRVPFSLKSILFAVKTRIALDTLMDTLKEKSETRVEIEPFNEDGIKGYKVIQPGAPPDRKLFLTSESDVILAASEVPLLKAALEAGRSGQTAFTSGRVNQGFDSVDRTGQVLFAVDASKFPPRPVRLQGMEDLQIFAASMRYALPRYDMTLDLQFSDPANAQKIAQTLEGLKGFAAANPVAKELVDKIAIAPQEQHVRITGAITDEEIQAITERMEAGAQEPAGGPNPVGATDPAPAQP